MRCCRLLACAVFALALTAPASAQLENVGNISFPTSAKPDAQRHFLRGVAILHSFRWKQAIAEFQLAQKAEPDFALAYWGESLCYNHPLNSQMDFKEPRAVLADLNTSPDLQVMALRSGYSQAGKLRAELKREAAQQSRRTAEGLASAYNARIIGLYTISDVAPDFAYGVRAGTWDAIDDDGFAPSAPPAPASSPDIGVVVSGNRIAAESLEAGAISFTENVYAIFLIAE